MVFVKFDVFWKRSSFSKNLTDHFLELKKGDHFSSVRVIKFFITSKSFMTKRRSLHENFFSSKIWTSLLSNVENFLATMHGFYKRAVKKRDRRVIKILYSSRAMTLGLHHGRNKFPRREKTSNAKFFLMKIFFWSWARKLHAQWKLENNFIAAMFFGWSPKK